MVESLRVAGLLVRCVPADIARVCEALQQVRGIEVHASDLNGSLVVTAEELPDSGTILSQLETVATMPGVLSSSLVFNYDGSPDPDHREACR